jgi:hypothetical protein
MPEIISMTAVAMFAAGTMAGRVQRSGSAYSAEGQFARAQVTKVWEGLDSAVSLQGPHALLFDELENLIAEHSNPGWDGHEAPPISYQIEQHAREFIRALPTSIPSPELAVDPDDAAISFEWYGGCRKVFSISLGASGRLACAGLNGTDRWHAALAFDGVKLPDLVLQSIRQVAS